MFLARPYWKYGKIYTLVTLFTSVVLAPLSSVAGTLLPKAAIDGVMRHDSASRLLLTVCMYTALILAVSVVQLIISSSYFLSHDDKDSI